MDNRGKILSLLENYISAAYTCARCGRCWPHFFHTGKVMVKFLHSPVPCITLAVASSQPVTGKQFFENTRFNLVSNVALLAAMLRPRL